MNLSRRHFLKSGLWLPVAPAILKAQDVIPLRHRGGNGLLNGLISYWQFENNGNDAKGSNTLTVAGGVYGGGLINLSFGYVTNGVISINPCPANMQLGAGKSFTVSTWWNGAGGASQEGVMSQFNNVAATSAWIIYMTAGSSALQFGGFTGSTQATLASFGTMTAAWHHVVFGFDSSQQKLFGYFDNGAKQTQATTGDLNGVSAQFSGGQVTGQAQYTGAVDETGFWNRVLTTTDVSVLYNSGAAFAFSRFTT